MTAITRALGVNLTQLNSVVSGTTGIVFLDGIIGHCGWIGKPHLNLHHVMEILTRYEE